MGGGSSKEGSWRQSSSLRSASSSFSGWSGYPPEPQYRQEAPSYTPQSYSSQPYYIHDPSPQDCSHSQATESKKRLDRKYSRITDNYHSLEEVSNVQ